MILDSNTAIKQTKESIATFGEYIKFLSGEPMEQEDKERISKSLEEYFKDEIELLKSDDENFLRLTITDKIAHKFFNFEEFHKDPTDSIMNKILPKNKFKDGEYQLSGQDIKDIIIKFQNVPR